MINDIYKSKILKYPLDKGEELLLNEVWRFINNFKLQSVFKARYRDKIIKRIRKKYTLHEFYLYESIANKLFWNLRWLIFPLWLNVNMTQRLYKEFIANNYNFYKKIPEPLTRCTEEEYYDSFNIKDHKIYESTYYRSFINKIVMIDKKNGKIYFKDQEGSSHIFRQNYFNLMTMTILFDRRLYETIMRDPYQLKSMNIALPQYYDQQDYCFPNLNLCVYKIGTKKDRLNRIEKMYYNKDGDKAKYWFRLIS